MHIELAKDIESGLYPYKVLVRRHKNLTPWEIMQACTLHNLGKHRKKYREALLSSLRFTVRNFWIEGIKDPEISVKLNTDLKTIKAVRVRFGYINDIAGTHDQRRAIITNLYGKGETEEAVIKAVEAETGEPMTLSALRSFIYREGIQRESTYLGYDPKTMNKLRPFFIEHHQLSDSMLSLKVDVSRATVAKYRKIFINQLIEKEKAAS